MIEVCSIPFDEDEVVILHGKDILEFYAFVAERVWHQRLILSKRGTRGSGRPSSQRLHRNVQSYT